MGKKIDLTRKRFNRLLVVEEAGRDKHNQIMWGVRCDCGTIKIVQGGHLRSCAIQSCGCLRKEILSEIGKANCGKSPSGETRKKISEANSGKNSPRWNPNLTDDDRQATRQYPEYLEWRKRVYERDNYTCQVCGDDKGGNLIAHHLEGYTANPELRTTLSNGITLCKECHKDFHHQLGRGNNTKEQFEEFLEEARNV